MIRVHIASKFISLTEVAGWFRYEVWGEGENDRECIRYRLHEL